LSSPETYVAKMLNLSYPCLASTG